ncbi:lipoprotein [Clostridia bacterium]|nr:lipoprotein [Clostridia bacterium]
MKKKLALVLAIAMIAMVALSACTNSDKGTPSPSPTTAATPSPTDEKTPDANTNASPTKETTDPAVVVKSLGKDGEWILSLLGDVTVTDKIVVEGTFYDAHNETREYRKLALYAQDADRKVTANYTLTASGGIEVKTPNFYIWNGTVKGDITVDANNFTLYNTTVEGTITFTKQEYKDSARFNAGTDDTTDPATTVGTEGTTKIDSDNVKVAE